MSSRIGLLLIVQNWQSFSIRYRDSSPPVRSNQSLFNFYVDMEDERERDILCELKSILSGSDPDSYLYIENGSGRLGYKEMGELAPEWIIKIARYIDVSTPEELAERAE